MKEKKKKNKQHSNSNKKNMKSQKTNAKNANNKLIEKNQAKIINEGNSDIIISDARGLYSNISDVPKYVEY